MLGGSGLVAIRSLFSEQWNTPELVDAFDQLPSLEMVEASARDYRQSAFATLWEHEDFRELDECMMGQARELTVSSYLQLAFRIQQPEQRAVVAERLGASGLACLCSSETELKELALLSLHFGGPGEAIDRVAKQLQRSTQVLTNDLNQINDRSRQLLGVELFELDEGRSTAAV